MKKISVIAAICVIALAQIASAQVHTQFLTFNDNNGVPDAGTYNPNDSFSFDIFLTFAGYDCYGPSFWLETQTLNNFAASLAITGFTYGTAFPDVLQGTPNPAPFDVLPGTSSGYRRDGRDLGSLVAGEGNDLLPQPPGTYFVGHVSLTISGAAPGTYILRSTTVFPDASEATSFDGTAFEDDYLPAEQYTITIVPEPNTYTLVTLAAIGAGAWICRRTVTKRHRA